MPESNELVNIFYDPKTSILATIKKLIGYFES